jgi:hypothetical protein
MLEKIPTSSLYLTYHTHIKYKLHGGRIQSASAGWWEMTL